MTNTLSTRQVSADRVTVADAANLFLDQLYARARARQVGWGHFRGCQHRLRRVVDVMTPALPLRMVGSDVLAATVLHFACRPTCLIRRFQHEPPVVPMSTSSAHTYVVMIKTLFNWIAEHEQLAWDRPKAFNRIFKIKQRNIKTPEELEREGVQVVSGEVKLFSMEDLTRLFRAGTSRDRLFILLGLNCGFTSGEISSLRSFEVVLDTNPRVHRRRPKTGVEAKWCLWPETVTLLRRHRAPSNRERLWLQTECGNSLVEVDELGRRDAVARSWEVLCHRAHVSERMGHRFLRKTGASAIKRIGGLEESEMYLAHQEPGMNKHYANRNWHKLWTCLEAFRAGLPFLGPSWELDPAECLFTQTDNPEWSEANPPWVQNVTKRSRSRLLNVSLSDKKGAYYARVYEDGVTYSRGYFSRADDAAEAARRIRSLLEAGLDPRVNLPETLRGQRRLLASARR